MAVGRLSWPRERRSGSVSHKRKQWKPQASVPQQTFVFGCLNIVRHVLVGGGPGGPGAAAEPPASAHCLPSGWDGHCSIFRSTRPTSRRSGERLRRPDWALLKRRLKRTRAQARCAEPDDQHQPIAAFITFFWDRLVSEVGSAALSLH